MYKFNSDGGLRVDRPADNLDEFTFDFIKVLRKHCHYSLVGGFLAIALGRSRSTEDVDMYIPRITKPAFLALYKDLTDCGFWCLNAESGETVFGYLKDNIGIRFAKKGMAIPNIELKFVRDSLDEACLEDTFKLFVGRCEFIFSSLEMNIAFKRFYLKSQKDIEDATHIEMVFKGRIDQNKIDKYKRLIARSR